MALEISEETGTKFESMRSSLGETVVQRVAEAEGADPTELSPLYDQVDPDALEKLFRNSSNGYVAFDYHEHTVIVRSDGAVSLE